MEIAALLKGTIQQSIDKIDEIVKRKHPEILAKMAEELFANEGEFNGRPRWKPNKASTVRRKGGNSPNIETGFLEHQMSTPGVLEENNWLDSIPSKRSDTGYKHADKLRKFSDIGQTEEDLELIDKRLEDAIRDEYS